MAGLSVGLSGCESLNSETAVSASSEISPSESEVVNDWNKEVAISVLEACQIDYSLAGAADGPVSAATALESDTLVTDNGWLVADLTSSWDEFGISAIEANCLYSEIGLSSNLISVINDDAKQQKANFKNSTKGAAEYRKSLESLQEELSAAKSAPEWNQRLERYYAELKAKVCDTFADCEDWQYTAAGMLWCTNAEFCDENNYFPNRSPKPAGPKLEAEIESKIEVVTTSLNRAILFEEDSLDLFKSIGEKDLKIAFVFDETRKLILVIGRT
jgi:hypothetical protein